MILNKNKQKQKLIIFVLILLSPDIIRYFSLHTNKDKYNNLIKVAFYCDKIKYGGVERVVALLINFLSNENNFSLYLITNKGLLEGEYIIPNNTKRIFLYDNRRNLIRAIRIHKIDILIYNTYVRKEIKKLNKLKNTKIIYYNHSSFLYWIYNKIYNFEKSIYYIYRNCNYVISLIPLENDYLFKQWGINSIFMDNPTTFNYDLITPSDLSQKIIIMVGRAEDPIKRYDIGIKAMSNIIKEIPESEMKIISESNVKYQNLINSLFLEKKVKFIGFQKNIDVYLKNASLHILPSLSEAYPMILGETKIFGIPSILCGLDYLALAKEGTIIIYDDNPDTIAKEAIHILKDDEFRKKLGNAARKSMERHKNNLVVKKWVKLLLAVYKGNIETFRQLQNSDLYNHLSQEDAENILFNQLGLLKKRIPQLSKITLEQLKSFSLN